MTKIVLRPAARRDILLQMAYYLDEDAVDAARRFPSAVEEGFRQLRERPGVGSPRFFKDAKWKGLRSWPVPGFEDVRIYYLHPEPSLIRVLRIVHGKRDLGVVFGEAEQ